MEQRIHVMPKNVIGGIKYPTSSDHHQCLKINVHKVFTVNSYVHLVYVVRTLGYI